MTLATNSADSVPEWARSRLACPDCLSSLVWLDGCCRCSECASEFVIKLGIPILLPHGQESSSFAQQKVQQAHFFDYNADEEFEISRPHGTSRLYEWCIQRKFARSIDGLEKNLRPEAVVLAVCGGSGMDAEFIASSGSSVICLDISFEAARRAKERARRHGLSIFPIVADAECLPLPGESVDVAFVHDGLHHLEDPSTGLREMARVARVSVAVSEPARALGTALAARLGLAEEIEEAGNRVNRLTLVGVTRTLDELGFTTVASERYILVYRHFPGRVSKLLSRHGLFFCAKLVFRAADIMAGRWGNKLSVRATRAEACGW